MTRGVLAILCSGAAVASAETRAETRAAVVSEIERRIPARPGVPHVERNARAGGDNLQCLSIPASHRG